MGQAQPNRLLVTVEVVRTVAWAFFVGRIVAIPRNGGGWVGPGWPGSCTVVIGECLTLNYGRCSLTPIATRFTVERHLGS